MSGSNGWTRRDGYALVACLAVGLGLAIAPHVAMRVRYGTWAFLADNDDLIYLAVSRAPYAGDWGLRDPFCGRWEHVPSLYSWAMFVPPAKVAGALGWPLLLTGLVWRGIGGLLLSSSLYLLFRRLFAGITHPTAWALGCTLVCLADGGFVEGHSFLRNATLVRHLVAGTTPMTKPDALPQYRVVTPLLNLPFLLLVVASLLTVGRGRWRDAAVGAIALGVCSLMYFFFWTAAVGGLGLYGLWWLWVAWRSPERREDAWREVRRLVLVVVGGLAIGAPQIASNSRTLADPMYKPILERMFKPIHLEPGEAIARSYLRNSWAWGKILVGVVAVILLRDPRLALLASVTLAGFLLANSALLTNLEFENFHWFFVTSTVGQILLLGVLGLAWDRWPGQRPAWLRLGWIAPLLLVLIAGIWRPYEALRAPESARLGRILQELRPLGPSLAAMDIDAAMAGPKEASVALLFGQNALIYSSPYSWFTLIPEDVVHERHALNGWLLGMDRDEYRAAAEADHNAEMFPRPQWEPAVIGPIRLKTFDALEAGGARDLLTRYRPEYLLLPSSKPRPERAGPWSPIQTTSDWTLWTRRPASTTGPPGNGVGSARPDRIASQFN